MKSLVKGKLSMRDKYQAQLRCFFINTCGRNLRTLGVLIHSENLWKLIFAREIGVSETAYSLQCTEI